jgi:hypothetical protein
MVRVVAASLHRRNQLNLTPKKFDVENLVVHHQHAAILNRVFSQRAKDRVDVNASEHLGIICLELLVDCLHSPDKVAVVARDLSEVRNTFKISRLHTLF